MRHSQPGGRSATGELPAPPVPPGRRPAVHRRPHRGGHRALADRLGGWLDRIFSPLVTLWVFLGQVLSADHSCRAAVARLIAHRLARGQEPCSAETGAYCQARKRLPESFFSDVARRTGRAWTPAWTRGWLWKRRRVYVYDGSSVTMPDTPENQAAYPQPSTQKPGLGFPLARIGAVFSLACGAVVDLGICRYAGKGQSELGLLRNAVGRVPPRRRPAGRPADVRLDRDGDAQAARRRLRVPPHVAPQGRLPPRASGWARATTSSGGPSRRSRGRSTGRPTTRCPSP